MSEHGYLQVRTVSSGVFSLGASNSAREARLQNLDERLGVTRPNETSTSPSKRLGSNSKGWEETLGPVLEIWGDSSIPKWESLRTLGVPSGF